MTKKLLIVRHAKAEPDTAGERDFDRELTMTGTMQTSRMGKVLQETGFATDAMLASPAARTLATASLLAEQLGFDTRHIQTFPELYNGSVKTWLEKINTLDEKYESVMLVGHNPHISYLAEYLTQEATGELKTCGMVLITWEGTDWAAISGGSGKWVWTKEPE